MDLQFDKDELEFSLNLAKIKNWLKDDLHKRLFHVLTLESYSKDPENKSKKLFVIASKDIDPTSFALTLKRIREKKESGGSFSTFLMTSILILCKMTETQNREETLKFVEEKEQILKPVEDSLFLGIEDVKRFLRKDKNRKYVAKILKDDLEPDEGKIIYDAFKTACNTGTLEERLDSGYNEENGIWKGIVEMVKAIIQMKGQGDIADEDLGDENDYD